MQLEDTPEYSESRPKFQQQKNATAEKRRRVVETSQQMGDEETYGKPEQKNNPEKLKTINSKLVGRKDTEQSKQCENYIPRTHIVLLYVLYPNCNDRDRGTLRPRSSKVRYPTVRGKAISL